MVYPWLKEAYALLNLPHIVLYGFGKHELAQLAANIVKNLKSLDGEYENSCTITFIESKCFPLNSDGTGLCMEPEKYIVVRDSEESRLDEIAFSLADLGYDVESENICLYRARGITK